MKKNLLLVVGLLYSPVVFAQTNSLEAKRANLETILSSKFDGGEVNCYLNTLDFLRNKLQNDNPLKMYGTKKQQFPKCDAIEKAFTFTKEEKDIVLEEVLEHIRSSEACLDLRESARDGISKVIVDDNLFLRDPNMLTLEKVPANPAFWNRTYVQTGLFVGANTQIEFLTFHDSGDENYTKSNGTINSLYKTGALVFHYVWFALAKIAYYNNMENKYVLSSMKPKIANSPLLEYIYPFATTTCWDQVVSVAHFSMDYQSRTPTTDSFTKSKTSPSSEYIFLRSKPTLPMFVYRAEEGKFGFMSLSKIKDEQIFSKYETFDTQITKKDTQMEYVRPEAKNNRSALVYDDSLFSVATKQGYYFVTNEKQTNSVLVQGRDPIKTTSSNPTPRKNVDEAPPPAVDQEIVH